MSYASVALLMALKRMRWQTFFFLQGKDSENEYDGGFGNFGFKSRKCPPQVKDLKSFEEDMLQLVEKISLGGYQTHSRML